MTPIPRRNIAVVLAAGAGTRYQSATHKLLAAFRGATVVGWALEHARTAALDATWVVTGAIDLTQAGVVPAGVEVLVNDRWAQGQATSLQVAVAAARADPTIGSLVIGLGDQPLVSPEAWRAVARSRGHPIAAASYRGQRRNPVRIDRPCWSLLPTIGDEGARILMRQRPDLVMEVPVDDLDGGDPVDIDTVADLADHADHADAARRGDGTRHGDTPSSL